MFKLGSGRRTCSWRLSTSTKGSERGPRVPGVAETRAAEPLGRRIAELHPSESLWAAAAFPWLLCICRCQVLGPASRDTRSHTAPRRTPSPRPGSALLWGSPGWHPGVFLPGSPCALSCVRCMGQHGQQHQGPWGWTHGVGKKMVLRSFRSQQTIMVFED